MHRRHSSREEIEGKLSVGRPWAGKANDVQAKPGALCRLQGESFAWMRRVVASPRALYPAWGHFEFLEDSFD